MPSDFIKLDKAKQCKDCVVRGKVGVKQARGNAAAEDDASTDSPRLLDSA